MKRCRICGKEEKQLATGTHIFPVWILKTTFGDRCAEIMHRITGLETPLPHIGREVDPKVYADLLNHIPSEDELEKIKGNNKLVVDEYWCSSCENRITLVENYFQKYIENVLLKQPYDSNDFTIKSFSKLNTDYVKLFIYSIVFRASLINFSNFSLELEYDNYLRKILKECLPFHKSNISEGCNLINHELANISILILRAEQIEQQKTNPVLIHRVNKNLFVFFINQYIFILSDKTIDTNILDSDIFGLRPIILENIEELNIAGKKLNIGIISSSSWITIIDSIKKWVCEIKQKNIDAIFYYSFIYATGHKPSSEDYKCFRDELAREDINDQRFSEERFLMAIQKSISRC
jgi:hypothetical protein